MNKLFLLILCALLLTGITYAAVGINLDNFAKVGLDKGAGFALEQTGSAGPQAGMILGILSGNPTSAAMDFFVQEAGKNNPDIQQLQTLIYGTANPLSFAQQQVLQETMKSMNKEQAKAIQLFNQLQEHSALAESLFTVEEEGTATITQEGNIILRDEQGNTKLELPHTTQLLKHPTDPQRYALNNLNGEELVLLDQSIIHATNIEVSKDTEQGTETLTFKNQQGINYCTGTQGTCIDNLGGDITITTKPYKTEDGTTKTKLHTLKGTITQETPRIIINGKTYTGLHEGDQITYLNTPQGAQLTITRTHREELTLPTGKTISGSFTLAYDQEERESQLLLHPQSVLQFPRLGTIYSVSSPERTLINFDQRAQGNCGNTCAYTITENTITAERSAAQATFTARTSQGEFYTLTATPGHTIQLGSKDRIITQGATGTLRTPTHTYTLDREEGISRISRRPTQEGSPTHPHIRVLRGDGEEEPYELDREGETITITTAETSHDIEIDEETVTQQEGTLEALEELQNEFREEGLTFSIPDVPTYRCAGSVQQVPRRIHEYDDAHLIKAATTYGHNPAILQGILIRESGGDCTARPPGGASTAYGCFQLLDGTARDLTTGASAKFCNERYAANAPRGDINTIREDFATSAERAGCYLSYTEHILTQRGIITEADDERTIYRKVLAGYTKGPFADETTLDSAIEPYADCILNYADQAARAQDQLAAREREQTTSQN